MDEMLNEKGELKGSRINDFQKLLSYTVEVCGVLIILDTRYLEIKNNHFIPRDVMSFIIVVMISTLVFKTLNFLLSLVIPEHLFDGLPITKNTICDMILWILSIIIFAIVIEKTPIGSYILINKK